MARKRSSKGHHETRKKRFRRFIRSSGMHGRHKTAADCAIKQRYKTREEAQADVESLSAKFEVEMRPYLCRICGHYHLTKVRPKRGQHKKRTDKGTG